MTDYAAKLLFMVYHSGVDVSVRYAGVEEKPIQRIGPVPCDKWILRLSCERRRGEIVIWTATKSGVAADLGAFLLDAFEYVRLAERMRDWEDLAGFADRPITIPALFIGGDRDGRTIWGRPSIDRFPETLPKLTRCEILPGCGHWTQQERPDATNELLIEFLNRIH